MTRSANVRMAVVHRTSDVGIDLPPGACASDLAPTDYLPIEMDDESKIGWASIPHTGDVGLDLPPGASAGDLEPDDYRPVDMELNLRASGRKLS